MGNYQELRKQIALYFDNELCENEKVCLLEKVNSDSVCNSLFEKEKKFRDFIKNNIKRPEVSSDLISNIKNKITSNP